MTRKMRKSDNIAIVRKMCVTRWWWWFEGGRTDFRTLLSKKGHHHYYLSFSSPGLQKNVAICASFICINTWDLMTPIFAARVQTYNKFCCCPVLYNDKVRFVDTIPFFSNLHTHVLSFFLLCSIFNELSAKKCYQLFSFRLYYSRFGFGMVISTIAILFLMTKHS